MYGLPGRPEQYRSDQKWLAQGVPKTLTLESRGGDNVRLAGLMYGEPAYVQPAGAYENWLAQGVPKNPPLESRGDIHCAALQGWSACRGSGPKGRIGQPMICSSIRKTYLKS